MTDHILNIIISFLFVGLVSCSPIKKTYSVKEVKHEPYFWGEIKENNLTGIADTTIVSIHGNVSDFGSAAENIELNFINKNQNKTYKTITNFYGDFQLNIPNGIYKIQIEKSEFKTLEFDDLSFKPGELRELKVYTESGAEYVGYETIFKNKRAYKKYKKEYEKNNTTGNKVYN
ncbi:carboxypeptidase-like regulatory domain-containing protein [Aquimarina sp. 2304DJ70-9]|uniref:carboxypeptidase-like regulatory domain-containing protein n=1 Tax=Aquimarina penaris TaxID=3231044 RepID=UPI0034628561